MSIEINCKNQSIEDIMKDVKIKAESVIHGGWHVVIGKSNDPIMEFTNLDCLNEDEQYELLRNLDVMIKFEDQIIAIESKFTEPYTKKRNKNSHIQDSYTKKSLWKEIPHIEKLANAIHAQNYQIENCEIKESIEVLRKTKRLDAAQLIKHILGLRTDDDKEILKNKEIILLYLWYDVPNSEEAKEHQEEIEAFASIAKADGINFRHITYQKVIEYLENYKNEHKDYIDYLGKRYIYNYEK